jgi:leucyl aminopeptidase
MDLIAKHLAFTQQAADCVVMGIDPQNPDADWAAKLETLCPGQLPKLLAFRELADVGATAWLYPETGCYQAVLLVSLGSLPMKEAKPNKKSSPAIAAKAPSPQKWLDSVAQALSKKPVKTAVIQLDSFGMAGNEERLAERLGQSLVVAAYRYGTTRKLEEPLPALAKVWCAHADKALVPALKRGLARGQAVGNGINCARQLGNLPANYCTPSHLAREAQALAKTSDALTVKILDAAEMKTLGMGALLSVAAGSVEPPKLVIMEYRGPKAQAEPQVLVGKGITFDTGGISLKPGPGMDEMKFDMCGAASVLGVMTALVEMKAPGYVVGVIAAAENMPSGKATKPGDVVTSMSGKTIEILNTDAEGRLVLCDALTYVERYKPKAVIDIATLTGACVVALGAYPSGLWSNQTELSFALVAAGDKADDRVWPMPLWDDYQKGLKSPFADLANVGPREGGAITAACFLARFTESYAWAHLDIAGTAWQSGQNKGATGRPVALLLEYLRDA